MEKKWFALRVHTCCERKAEGLLRSHLYVGETKVTVETFLPVQKEFLNPATGIVERNRMVVEGLLFVRIIPAAKLINAIRNTPYVLDFYHASVSHAPEAIPEEQMERLRRILNDSPYRVEMLGEVQKGDKVRVKSGKLEGLVGTVMEDESGSYICVALDILGQYVRTHIEKSEIAVFDSTDETSLKKVQKRLARPDAQRVLAAIGVNYNRMAALYPSQCDDQELCDLVRFYQILLGCPRLLLVLQEHLWKDNRYGHQHFFAEIYGELARRVKATRLKENRAPMLHALHCLCHNVSLRAYTRKTSEQWVAECVVRTNDWFVKHKSAEEDYSFVQLLFDAPEGDSAVERILAGKVERWFSDFTDAGALQRLSSGEIALRLRLLVAYVVKYRNGKKMRKGLLAQLTLLADRVLESESASDALLLLEALAVVNRYAARLSRTDVFAKVQHSLPSFPPSLSSLCLETVCQLLVLNQFVGTE